jgi:hypothetical protein
LGGDQGSQNREFIDQVGGRLATVVGFYEATSTADEFGKADRVLATSTASSASEKRSGSRKALPLRAPA